MGPVPGSEGTVAPRARPISASDLDQLATGAWVLGTGGGGDPYHSLLALKALYSSGRSVTLLDAIDLADDDLVAVISQMGAPLVNRERLPDPVMIERAVRLMEESLGRPFTAMMSLEIGGANAFQPLFAAALMDRPVVDADAMGRAFPSIFHSSFAAAGLTCRPFTMVDIRDNAVLITEAADWFWLERISRALTTEFGSRAFTCKPPRTGREVKQAGILGTVSQAIEIGRTVQQARAVGEDPVASLLCRQGGRALFVGKVRDVARRATAGFLRGRVEISGLDADAGAELRLDFQNEFLIARRNGAVQATVPELICVLDSESGEAIGTETLRYGQRVTVIALPAPAVFLTENGLQHTGPRAFGYDLEFVSVFDKDEA